MPKQSKRYREAAQVADLTLPLALEEAVEVLCKMPKAKFDETVELAVSLGVDPRQTNQMVRGTVSLPKGSGKSVRVIVFTDNPQEALDAGAAHAGLDDLLKKIQDGWLDFDVAVATTAAMKQVRTVARVLGPRGLMPNPKSGTVSDDIPSAVKEVMGGRVEFKMDKTANLAIVVGKRSFESGDLLENIKAAIDRLGAVRPDGFKGRYIEGMSLSSTMSPAVKLESTTYSKL